MKKTTSQINKNEGKIIKTLFQKATTPYEHPSKSSTNRNAEVHITKSTTSVLKDSKTYKKAMFQNEVAYNQINPNLEHAQRLDICCYYDGKFHFIEYKHHDRDRGGDSNLAILRQSINDISKLNDLMRSSHASIDLKSQTYTYCCYIEESEKKDRENTAKEDFKITEKAAKVWFTDRDFDNTSNSFGRLHSKINTLYALVEHVNKNQEYPFEGKGYEVSNGAVFFVFNN